ncbi:MAG: 2-amino-4-hydroxy-6-hydroxymethyldihydropteridine diphosphokinase [Deltaproteobacteria bacterium]|jgi:2-amino-4-hydroxy-6-hydroxymethyldihydropteridine diphosphokinase|nr:2-amino-4-hydroxy-6-hydroxymethyldihydropteridine diphosphokinase [Deltaproteobacteria bacterium]
MLNKSYIAIGSNLGNREQNIRGAIDTLRSNPLCTVTNESRLYDTEPLLKEGSGEQGWYLNGAIEIETTLAASDLLSLLQEIEIELGRPLPRKSGEARIIDLDILFFEDLVIKTADLTIPHPELHKRMFVLQPLYDIAPTLMHPTLRMSVGDLKTKLDKILK